MEGNNAAAAEEAAAEAADEREERAALTFCIPLLSGAGGGGGCFLGGRGARTGEGGGEPARLSLLVKGATIRLLARLIHSRVLEVWSMTLSIEPFSGLWLTSTTSPSTHCRDEGFHTSTRSPGARARANSVSTSTGGEGPGRLEESADTLRVERTDGPAGRGGKNGDTEWD